MLQYKDIRSEIKSGDLISYSRKGLISYLIRFVTKSKFSHVGIAWVISGRVLILEATFKNGVSVRSLSSEDFYWSKGLKPWSEDMETRAIARLEKSYSVLNAIKVGLGISPTHYGEICTLYVDDVLDIPITLDTPGNIVDYFKEHGSDPLFVSV